MNLFSRKPSSNMTPLEERILESIRKEPSKWFFALRQGLGLVCTNREKTVTIVSRHGALEFPTATCGEHEFGTEFAKRFHEEAEKLNSERTKRDQAEKAATALRQLERAFL